MKHTFFILIFMFSLSLFAQTGVYTLEPQNTDGTKIKWTLSLNSDGTFIYHFFRDIVGERNPEENFYGKGTWESKGKLVYFFANKSKDFDGKYTKNLNNSKARITSKSPRDKSDRVVKTSIRFYDSELSEITGLELFKKDI
ncbi:NlpE N-terminal domain-containing protein [Flaviramulus basaltis]|uniref:NlpE N-terminal domain-containing protein n=1 Tax=Flaviramulus basaltis TaxID=369401 RepID=A0A1K2IC31_9FLAO|nr:copper resistance protein NlpE N-terminal domain-containing protein [Flaviramulus basaltis]SFZ89959.1 NlpE N-terminal domain-containing protein [Flaviramulus basaltis]